MRTFKFRAWDKERKLMCNVTNINFYDKYMFVEETPMTGWRLALETTPLMQYTGLTDKNEKPICEGDILQNTKEASIVSVKWDITGGRYIFEEHNVCMDDGFGRGNWDLTMGYARLCEVIGNIWEHPTLLQ